MLLQTPSVFIRGDIKPSKASFLVDECWIQLALGSELLQKRLTYWQAWKNAREPGHTNSHLTPISSPCTLHLKVILNTAFWSQYMSREFCYAPCNHLSCVCISFAVYADGGICLDILQNRWSPTYDVSSILTSIQVSSYLETGSVSRS